MTFKPHENHAILVRIDWNENKWEKPSTNLNPAKSFDFVKENNISYTAFNFAHELYNTENDGLWYGLIPAFYSKTPDSDKTRNLKVIFMISNFEKKDYIIGLYTFPKIGNGHRKNLIPDYPNYNIINIGATPSNIIRLENFVSIEQLDKRRYLGNQELSTQGWNYLDQSQTGYLFDCIQELNKTDSKLKKIKFLYMKSNMI